MSNNGSTVAGHMIVPTLLPTRVPEAPKPSDVPAWIAVALAFAVLVSLAIHSPANYSVVIDADGLAVPSFDL